MRFLRLAGLAAALIGTVSAAQTDLTPQEARVAAAKLLAAGHPRAAADITTALIKRNPGDAEALIIQAHAQRTMRAHKAAQQAARAGWRASDRPVEKYGAALAMAQALSSDGKKTRAQLWLRRAAHVAPSEALVARAARDYQYLRTTNPWSVNFSFGINPGNNVNNAPRDNTVVLGGLVFVNESAVPISGFEVQTNATLRYTLSESVTRRKSFALRWLEGHVVFTDADVPAGVDEADFAYRRLEGEFAWDLQNSRDAPRRNIALTFGRLWTAGDPQADEIKLSYRDSRTLSDGTHFGWHTSLGYSHRKDNENRSGFTGILGANWAVTLANKGVLSWSVGVGRTETDSVSTTHSKLDLGVTYALPEPVLGARASLAAHATLRAYDDPLYSAEARLDRSVTLSASLLFVDFDTYGFAPKLTVEANDTQSNITTFETQNFGLKIGWQSVF